MSETASKILLTEDEAAQLIGFKPRTLQAWRLTGGGPRYVSISSRAVRYRPEDLQEWAALRTRTSTSDASARQNELAGPEGKMIS